MNRLTNLSARTAQPNTRETDRQPQVLHIVEGRLDGVRVQARVMADDPLHAINLAHKGRVVWEPIKEDAP